MKKKINILLTFLLIFQLGCIDDNKHLEKKKKEIWKSSKFNWENPKFKNAKAYYYQIYKSSVTGEIVSEKWGSNIVLDGKLNRTTWKKSEKRLNSAQLNMLNDISQNKFEKCYNSPNLCYDPHHGIVFYDELNFAIASISICFECSIVKYYPSNKFNGQCLDKYRELFNELKIEIPTTWEEIHEYGKKIYKKKENKN